MARRTRILSCIALGAALQSLTAPTAGAQPARATTDIVVDTSIPAAAVVQSGSPLDPVAATNAYLARVPATQRARSDAYYEGGYWIGLWDTLITVAVMLALLHFGVSRHLRDRVERMSRSHTVQTLSYATVFVALTTVIYLPWTIYTRFLRERQYDLMNQAFPAWLIDYGKQTLIGMIFAGIAVTGFYAIVRRVPRTWPLWGAAAGVVFTAFTALIYPVYVDPLFNRFTPVEDQRVRGPVLAMAHANGLPVDEVYVVDQSRQTKRISAYVTGILNTRRVVLNDNLLARTSLPEIKAVMGHEIGHYVLNHVYEFLFMYLILLVAGFLLLQRAFEWAAARWGPRWGVRGITDLAGLPLLMLVFTLIAYVAMPVTRSITRSNEAEADAFGLNAAREPDGFARVAVRLGEYRKLDPSPLEEALFFTHPSGRNRIYRSMVWKAANAAPATEPPSPD